MSRLKSWKRIIASAAVAVFVGFGSIGMMDAASAQSADIVQKNDAAYYHCYRAYDSDYDHYNRDCSRNYRHGGHHGCW